MSRHRIWESSQPLLLFTSTDVMPSRAGDLRYLGPAAVPGVPPVNVGRPEPSASPTGSVTSQASVHLQPMLGPAVQRHTPPKLLGLMRRAGEARCSAGSQSSSSQATSSDSLSAPEETTSNLLRGAGLLKRVRNIVFPRQRLVLALKPVLVLACQLAPQHVIST